MTGATEPRGAAAAVAPSASPFTLLAGAPDAMVCEGDVCWIPGTDAPVGPEA